MRRFACVFLILLSSQNSGVLVDVAAKTLQQSQTSIPTLTTEEVLGLIKSGVSTESIVAKLHQSICTCDVSEAAIRQLKSTGVADEIVAAMIKAQGTMPPAQRHVVTIPKDTVVEVEAAYRVNSQEIRQGEAITFHVVAPVIIGETCVIQTGSIATAKVLKSTRGAHFGRAGRISWNMENVLAVDGTKVPIQADGHTVGDSKGAKVATQIVITGALLGPFAAVALLHGFKRGENAYIPQGRRFRAVVSVDTTVKVDR